ncbi:malonyl-ACP O-methyltransferase BioC [Oxalobacter paraformigenes]|nr:malonyl-ACP O-methyltransferase BioC [Oxalobacter paraformigenes]
MEKTKIGEAFGRAAPCYDTLAVFQRQVCEKMLCLLPEWLPAGFVPESLLDGGCGTGFGAECLRCLWPDASLTGCDLSDAMVGRMRQKGFDAVPGDLENLPFSSNCFDFVWSSLALQWCDPGTVFPELHRVLRKGGVLYFSTLAPGTLPEIGFAFSGIDESKRVLEFHPADELEKCLHQAGFGGIRLLAERRVMYYPDVRSALESIRGIGAGQAARKRRALMGRQAWKKVQERYESLRDENGLPVTYELIFGYALAGR